LKYKINLKTKYTILYYNIGYAKQYLRTFVKHIKKENQYTKNEIKNKIKFGKIKSIKCINFSMHFFINMFN
jgi:hypothetical protein